MDSEDTSCSDCKLEIVEKRWTQLLLNWLNKCVHPNSPVNELNNRSLMEIVNKYKQDICVDDIDRAVLFSEDLDQFIKYKYPILRLRYFYEVKEFSKKLFLTHTIMLFHCCVNSIDGLVDSDICVNLAKFEQEMILKFCEKLSDMEVTASNIESAIKDACDSVKPGPRISKKTDKNKKSLKIQPVISDSYEKTASPEKASVSSMPSEDKTEQNTTQNENSKKKINSIKFKSSLIALSSDILDSGSSYSDIDYVVNYGANYETGDKENKLTAKNIEPNESLERRCQPSCACSRCDPTGPCCGDPGNSTNSCDEDYNNPIVNRVVTERDSEEVNSEEYKRGVVHSFIRFGKFKFNWKVYFILLSVVLSIIISVIIVKTKPWATRSTKQKERSTVSKMAAFKLTGGSPEPRYITTIVTESCVAGKL